MAVLINQRMRFVVSMLHCNNVNKLVQVSIVALVIVMCLGPVHTASVDGTCSNVKATFAKRGFVANDIPTTPILADMRICANNLDRRSCCSESIETKLASHVRKQLDNNQRDTLSRLATILDTRAKKFDEFFRDLLLKSKRDFHDMFKRTYGSIYLQNSDVFTDLFSKLETYYDKGQVDLVDALGSFFNDLYQRMFIVLNSQYEFDKKYLKCIGDNTKEMKPFGDVPHKLNIEVKRSFIATRTFAKALGIGAEVVQNMLNMKASPECEKAVLQMEFCSGCSQHTVVKACANYCINVMKGCFAYHADLNTDWNNLVDAIDRIAERLLGPFNIEMVVEPLNIKISEAIMNFQENGKDISERIFQGCGNPIAKKRSRRDYDDDLEFDDSFEDERNKRDSLVSLSPTMQGTTREIKFESLNFNGAGGFDKDDDVDESDRDHPELLPGMLEFETLLKDIRARVKDTKHFWSHLPYKFCNDEEIAETPSNDKNCWNGTHVDRYEASVVGNGVLAQINNTAVYTDISRPSLLVNEQVLQLRTIVNKLKNAFTGMDVNWIDYDDTEQTYGSGSGSGDTESDDEDDTKVDMEEGSGSAPDYNPVGPEEGLDAHATEKTPTVIQIASKEVEKTEDKTSITRSGTDRGSETGSGAGSSHGDSKMSLTKALVTYMFPIFVMWVGGMVSEVL